MIIEDIIDYTENANSLAEKLHSQETAFEKKEREMDFVKRFSRYVEKMAIVEAMINVMPIIVKTSESDILKTALSSGQRVYKNLQISNAVPSNNVQDAVDVLDKISNKWKKQFLSSVQVNETLRMLELVMPIYKGTPSPKDLIDSIQAIDDDILSVDLINSAKDSVDIGTEILSSMEIDDDIKDFLKKVSTNSASLLDVNESILQWLGNNDLLNKMKVSIN